MQTKGHLHVVMLMESSTVTPSGWVKGIYVRATKNMLHTDEKEETRGEE